MSVATVAVLIILVASEIQLTEANCSPDLYYDFLECIHGNIRDEWSALASDPDGKLEKEETRVHSCFKDGKCDKALDFDKDIVEHLDATSHKMINLMQDFWYSLPLGMQTCILTNARDGFFDDLQVCVRKSGYKEYTNPKFGPFPMPGSKLFTSQMLPKLRKRNDDKVIAALSAHDCASPKSVLKCTENITSTFVRQCFRKNLCSNKECKGSITEICVGVDKCVPQLVNQFVEQMSNLDDDDEKNYIKKMESCEKAEQKTNAKYLYSRVKAARIYGEFKRHQSEPATIDSFKKYLDEMVKGYLDIHSICSNSC